MEWLADCAYRGQRARCEAPNWFQSEQVWLIREIGNEKSAYSKVSGLPLSHVLHGTDTRSLGLSLRAVRHPWRDAPICHWSGSYLSACSRMRTIAAGVRPILISFLRS